jgi:hypothetical protein
VSGTFSPGNSLRRRSSESVSLGGDELLARAELRRQIGRLEFKLARLTFDGFGRLDVPHRVAAAASGPRMLDLGGLERVRDELAERVGEAAAALAAKAALETANRELLRALIDVLDVFNRKGYEPKGRPRNLLAPALASVPAGTQSVIPVHGIGTRAVVVITKEGNPAGLVQVRNDVFAVYPGNVGSVKGFLSRVAHELSPTGR